MRDWLYEIWFYHIWPIQLGIRNIRRWYKIVWRDEDCDWTSLAEMMETKMRCMADLHENEGHLAERHRTAKQMRTCAALLKRMQEDRHFHNAGYDPDTWNELPESRKRWIVQHASYMDRQDKRYLGVLIGKYLDHWWD